MPASCTCSGAGKSGWPMQKLMMSLPWRASALTSASTTKAFSVPSDCARLLILVMGYFNFEESARPDRAIASFRQLETPDGATQLVRHGVARVARQRDVGAPGLLVIPDHRHRRGWRPPGGLGQRGVDRGKWQEHLQALGGGGRELHGPLPPKLPGPRRGDP